MATTEEKIKETDFEQEKLTEKQLDYVTGGVTVVISDDDPPPPPPPPRPHPAPPRPPR